MPDGGVVVVTTEQVTGQMRIKISDNGVGMPESSLSQIFRPFFTNFEQATGGIDVLRAVKRARPETQVILVSGFGSLDTAIDAVREGAFDYVSKPFNVEEVRATVQRALLKPLSCAESRRRQPEEGGGDHEDRPANTLPYAGTLRASGRKRNTGRIGLCQVVGPIIDPGNDSSPTRTRIPIRLEFLSREPSFGHRLCNAGTT
jgi:hypothetical protein